LGHHDDTVQEVTPITTVALADINWDVSVNRVRVGEAEIIPFAECPLKLTALWTQDRPIPLPSSLPMMQA
jgi:hypothetical protein